MCVDCVLASLRITQVDAGRQTPTLWWFYHTCSCGLFGFSLKAEAQWPMAGHLVPISAEAAPLARASLSHKRMRGSGLHGKPALGEVCNQLMLEVTGEDPRRSKPIGFCLIFTREPPTSSRSLLDNLLKMVATPLRPLWRRQWQIMLEQLL
jgi:hypothetical protein